MTGPTGPVRMDPEGITHFELAVESLLKDQEVQKRWDSEAFWGLLASLVVALWSRGAPLDFAERQVARLRRARPSLVMLPAANVVWDAPPLTIAGAVMGDWDDPAFAEAVVRLDGTATPELPAEYISGQKHRRPMVGFATIVPTQMSRASSDAARRLEQLCDTALLLARDKSRHGLFSLRGAWNRPGVRGLTLDRKTVESAFQATNDDGELASQPLVVDELGSSSRYSWYSADPLPLSALLSDEEIRLGVEVVLGGQAGHAPRIQLAARWFAEAFWTTGRDDAALALVLQP